MGQIGIPISQMEKLRIPVKEVVTESYDRHFTTSSHLILRATLEDEKYCSHFPDEETESQRG